MRTTLKLIAAILVGSMAMATAADDAAKKKDKPGKKGARKGIIAADKDNDKKITLEEFKTWAAAKKKPIEGEKAAKIFARRDKNSDGALTKDELRRARAGKGKKKDGGAAEGEAKRKKGEGKRKKKKDAGAAL